MTPILSSTHMPALGEHVREEVGHELDAATRELVDLSLIGKQLHWSVTGRTFRPLHLYLDELVDSWRELSDTVAERAVALGHFPDGQARAVAESSELASLTPAAMEGDTVVRELVSRIAPVAERMRARMDRLGELDAASQDVLTEVVRALEEQLWMARSQLGD
jgi:starvation-inducible DNA-binding protein